MTDAQHDEPRQLEVTTTYLAMHEPPEEPPRDPPAGALRIARCRPPTVSFYRYLYNSVGEDWLWVDRRRMTDDQLIEIIHDRRVEVHVLYSSGSPAGFAELDRRRPGEIELAYFGLLPDFVGQGLGSYLLRWAIQKAWSYKPERFWLHTCSLDHPRALRAYTSAGLVPYKTETQRIENPRYLGLM